MLLPVVPEINPEEFTNEESEIHGRSHIHRVIYWVRKIAVCQGLKHLLPEALAAARLHDLARTHDGVCAIHGARATRLLDKYEPMFREMGVKDMEAVEYAVMIHCLPCPLDEEHPHYQVAAILRDADALDRFRFDRDGPRLDYLNFQRTQHFLGAAKALARETLDNETPLAEIERRGEEITNPSRGSRLVLKDDYDENEPPRRRRNRRLKQGKFADQMSQIVDDLDTRSIEARLKRSLQNAPERIGFEVRKAIEVAKAFAAAFAPATYLSEAALRAFLEEGKTKSIWELPEVTWHSRYAASEEDALDARAYNDARLWGEKGRGITHGVLLQKEDTQTDKRLREMYGVKRITWKKEVLRSASFCINDSQENPFCLPFDNFEESVLRSILPKFLQGLPLPQSLAQEFPSPLNSGQGFYFIEIQIHQPLTPQDASQMEENTP